MTEYYLAVDGTTIGPYSLSEIRRRHLAGELGPETLYHDGEEWHPLAELPGLVPTAPDPVRREAVLAGQLLAAEKDRTVGTARHTAKIVIFAAVGLAVCGWLFCSATISGKVASMADVRTLKTQLLVFMSQEGGIDPATGCLFMPPAAAQPKPLPQPMQQALSTRGFRNKWGHATEYVGDGTAFRYLVPLGSAKDAGVLVADPATLGVWLWHPDSGPLTWAAVRTVPASAIP